MHAGPARAGEQHDGDLVLERDLDRPCDLLADDHSHRTAEEREVHHADHTADAVDRRPADDHRVLLPGLLAGGRELLAVGNPVDESEPVLGCEVDEELLERALVGSQHHAFTPGQREVVAAAGADPVLGLELLAEQHGSAALTLDPQPIGHVLLLGEARPGHAVLDSYAEGQEDGAG